MEQDYYDTYLQYKGWHQAPDDSHDQFYRIETADFGLRPGAKIAELGFGEGRFLDFAKRAGYNPSGLELVPEFVEQVRVRGHRVEVGTRLSEFADEAGTFDVVAAIDVIEHLTVDELRTFFEDARLLLKPGGRVFVRFPNGNSPFGLNLYNSDVTHRSHLTGGSLKQVCEPLGFRLLRVGNPARDVVGGLGMKFRRTIQFAVRDLIEWVIGFAYFGRRVPLDVNLVAVLQKQE
jgi:SAM-dependent methyltransferase